MIFKNHLTREGEIKSIVLSKTEVVITTYKKERIVFKRTRGVPSETAKKFQGKRIIPANKRNE